MRHRYREIRSITRESVRNFAPHGVGSAGTGGIGGAALTDSPTFDVGQYAKQLLGGGGAPPVAKPPSIGGQPAPVQYAMPKPGENLLPSQRLAMLLRQQGGA